MLISDWSSDVCSSDLAGLVGPAGSDQACGQAGAELQSGESRHVRDRLQVAAFRSNAASKCCGILHGLHGHPDPDPARHRRAEKRRVGKECVGQGSFWWSQDELKKKTITVITK